MQILYIEFMIFIFERWVKQLKNKFKFNFFIVINFHLFIFIYLKIGVILTKGVYVPTHPNKHLRINLKKNIIEYFNVILWKLISMSQILIWFFKTIQTELIACIYFNNYLIFNNIIYCINLLLVDIFVFNINY